MLLQSEVLNTVKKRIDEAKYIPNYSNYLVLPNEGLVYSLKSNRFIGAKHYTGYWKCTLYGDNSNNWLTNVHRVVWIAVNGPIPQGLEVNHIDENKSNNSIDNLNLLTPKENTNYGTRNERAGKILKNLLTNRKDQSKPVGAFKDGKLVLTFASISEAKRNGFDKSNIILSCKGKYWNNNIYKGYTWQYL